eukprot:PRCOL_00001834-RA
MGALETRGSGPAVAGAPAAAANGGAGGAVAAGAGAQAPAQQGARAGGAPVAPAGSGRAVVRILVVGDKGVGKTSLVAAVATKSFPEGEVPSTQPLTVLAADELPDNVPVHITDSDAPADHAALRDEVRATDVIVLTYAADDDASLARVRTHWLPELRAAGAAVPVVLVGCRLDLRSSANRNATLMEVIQPIMNAFSEVETCLECSAKKLIYVTEVFYYAQKAVLHPTAPLYDTETGELKTDCVRALKRIFVLCDKDKDSLLSDEELNGFQVRCFRAPLQPEELAGVKRVIGDKMPSEVSAEGVTFKGFLYLHALFIEKGRMETTWTVLRRFGYSDDLALAPELLALPFAYEASQSVELSGRARTFLNSYFSRIADPHGDGFATRRELDELFYPVPTSPWEGDGVMVEEDADGRLGQSAFMAHWAATARRSPQAAHAALTYLGFSDDGAHGGGTSDSSSVGGHASGGMQSIGAGGGGGCSSALVVSRPRGAERRRRRVGRTTLRCVLVGAKGAGKRGLMNGLVGRPYDAALPDGVTTAAGCMMAVEGMDAQATATLLLTALDVDADCRADSIVAAAGLESADCCAFVFDSSSAESYRVAHAALLQVAEWSAGTDADLPCLMVAAKDDLGMAEDIASRSSEFCASLGLEPPVQTSVRAGDAKTVYEHMLSVAVDVSAGVPETEASRLARARRKQLVTYAAYGAAALGAVAIGAYMYRLATSTSKRRDDDGRSGSSAPAFASARLDL